MNPDPRQSAAADALLTPDSITIGSFTVRKLSGGDRLAAQRLGLTIASDDVDAIKALSLPDKTRELLSIGALLVRPRREVQAFVFGCGTLADDFVGDVAFNLSPDGMRQLIEWVAGFFVQAQQVDFDIEKKPSDSGDGKDSPKGKE